MSTQSSQSLSTQGSQSSQGTTVSRGQIGGRPRFGAKSALFDDQEAKQEKPNRKRRRPGAKALQEIRKYQKTTSNLLPREPFKRLVRETITEMTQMQVPRLENEALTALQEAAEAFLTTFFEAANRCAIHAKRVTLMPSDFVLLRWILNTFGVQIV